MAVDMFLKLDDIKGESKDHAHKDEIEVLAWSWGMSNEGTAHIAGGAGAGKVNVQNVTITKWADSATAALLKHCSKGKHIPKGKLVVRKAGDKPLEYIVLDMKKVFVTNISKGGSGGEDKLTENVTLNFEEFKYVYKPQKDDGSAGEAKEFAFNMAENQEK